MSPPISVVFILGPPGAGKSTLGALLVESFPVQHISVGDLLRRIKNDASHPQAGTIASALKTQELINAKVLVPIIREELEELRSQDQERRIMLIDGFPRNLAQQREFEKVFQEPILVLLFNCPKEIAKQRYLTRKLEGREADDEAMFEKRYAEYVRENENIICEYRERGLLVEIDTSKETAVSWGKLRNTLKRDFMWMDAMHNKTLVLGLSS